MRPTLAHAARLLADRDPAARTRGADLSYEICLARCVAPITPLAAPHVALGRDYALLAPVLRRLARALQVSLTDKLAVDLVINASRALAAVAALLVFAQRCDVHDDLLVQVAGPLLTRCVPALVAPLLAVDLRVVTAARDALDQIVLLRVAHNSPWLDVLLAIRTFRLHHTAADRRPLLEVVLARVATLIGPVFVDVARTADCADDASDAQPHTQRSSSLVRRRSSIRSPTAPPPVRISAMTSWHAVINADHVEPAQDHRRSRRFIDKLRPGRRRRGQLANSAGTQSTSWKCEENGVPCSGCPLCQPSEPESFETPRSRGMRFSKRSRRMSAATPPEQNDTNSHAARVSIDSVQPSVAPRSSVEVTRSFLGRRESINVNANVNGPLRMVTQQRRKRRGALAPDVIASTSNDIADCNGGAEWMGRQLGVGNPNIAAAMHIYERLLDRYMLAQVHDRCQVIDALHSLVHPLLTGVTAGQSNVDSGALRCVVANAFLAHGSAIYPALLSLVFRPAPSSERTEHVRRQLSLQPHLAAAISKGDRSSLRKGRSRTEDLAELAAGSTSTFRLGQQINAPDGNICLPNPDCDTDTALRCTALLTLLVRNVPDMCNSRLPLLTGTTNSAYWHIAEALVKSKKSRKSKNVSWSMERLIGAVDSLFLLNASMPESAECALKVVSSDASRLDYIIETCMRSVCSSGCRLARIDARKSAPSLSDTGVIESARAWAALSKLPSRSVLWPSSPAYSSAIVFIAHLARRTAVAVYNQRRWEELDFVWKRRDDVAVSTDPSTPLHLVSDDGAPETQSFDRVPTPISACTLPSYGIVGGGRSERRRAESGKSGGEDQTGNESTLTKCLQECIGILVERNGSGVVVHDLFRSLLYILGCELRGSPTRASFVSHNDRTSQGREAAISLSIAKASSLPSRAPFFTRSAHNTLAPGTKDSFTLACSVPRVEKEALGDPEMSSELDDVVDVQSLNRMSLDENDMSGLLVGNIAVDGSRDSKIRDIAAKAEGSAVASWFTGYSPPPLGGSDTMEQYSGKRGSADSRELTNPSIVDAAADSTFGVSPGYTPPVSRSRLEVDTDRFDQLSTAVALIINALTTSAAAEGEDVSVCMQHLASDVQRINCAMVSQLHKRAMTLLKETQLGNAHLGLNTGALVRQVRDLRSEVASLRNDVDLLKAALGGVDENWPRFRWPLRSFPRPNGDMPEHTSSSKRASYVQ